jgi:phosphomevalonate kinase
MIARAPGKVVLSGAYAVLDGAPAIVSAVDRYAVADSARHADFVTPEVRSALGARPAPWCDASALRNGSRKLGLGSSAAILVASLAALELESHGALDDAALSAAVFEWALDAHARAQGGGSGIDVAASAHGGTLVAKRIGDALAVEHRALPEALTIEVWAAPVSASTAELVARVRDLAARAPREYAASIGAQADAAERAASALRAGDARAFVEALGAEHAALARLDDASGAPIVLDEVRRLHAAAERAGAVVLPSGAGGGDVELYVGLAPPAPELCAERDALGRRVLTVQLGARGVHASS